MSKSEIIRITIPEFMTHAKKSKTKHLKINGQAIYNGSLHTFTRAKVVKQMHDYIRPFVNEELKGRDLSRLFPLSITLEFHAPINYGNVRLYKGEVKWKPPVEGFIATWDADNMWLWGKVFNDELTESGYIEDDSVSYVTHSGGVKFRAVDTFEERKLVFVIQKDV